MHAIEKIHTSLIVEIVPTQEPYYYSTLTNSY